jgi:lysophospholipase L1-like esterase
VDYSLSFSYCKREVESNFEYNKVAVNLGISGGTTADVLSRIKAETEARVLNYPGDDDVVVSSVGVNDFQYEIESGTNKVSINKSKENILTIHNEISGLVGRIVVVGLAPVFDERIQPMAWKPTHF